MTNNRKQVLLDAVYDCFRKMYKASTPSGDFDELMANASINERGQKEIPFNDYEISSEEYDKILELSLNDKKLKMTAYEKRAFSQAVHLGCSPKTKREY